MEIVEGNIPVEVYRGLRDLSGLSPKSRVASELGLKNSLQAVMIKIDDEIIGMGRLIGDGGCFCQVVDICVNPKVQGLGVGKAIMKNLMDFIEHHLPETCYVSLIADGDASYLYEKFGFRDTAPKSKGMYLVR